MPVQVCTPPVRQNNLPRVFFSPVLSGGFRSSRARTRGAELGGFSPGDSLFLLSIQVPDQRVPFVDQYDQFIQQQLLSSLLGLGLLPVCKQREQSEWNWERKSVPSPCWIGTASRTGPSRNLAGRRTKTWSSVYTPCKQAGAAPYECV